MNNGKNFPPTRKNHSRKSSKGRGMGVIVRTTYRKSEIQENEDEIRVVYQKEETQQEEYLFPPTGC